MQKLSFLFVLIGWACCTSGTLVKQSSQENAFGKVKPPVQTSVVTKVTTGPTTPVKINMVGDFEKQQSINFIKDLHESEAAKQAKLNPSSGFSKVSEATLVKQMAALEAALAKTETSSSQSSQPGTSQRFEIPTKDKEGSPSKPKVETQTTVTPPKDEKTAQVSTNKISAGGSDGLQSPQGLGQEVKKPGTGDQPSTQSPGLDAESSSVAINIRWEVASLKNYYEASNRNSEMAFMKGLINKANNIIQTFIRVDKKAPMMVVVGMGPQCSFYLQRTLRASAHFVMLVGVDQNPEDPDMIASGISCNTFKGERPSVGQMLLNPSHMVTPQDPPYKQMEFVNAIVHEAFHTMAFGAAKLDIKQDTADVGHLTSLLAAVPHAYNTGHWEMEFMPSDIMNPVSTVGSIVSVFDLEVFRTRHKHFQPSTRLLPYNFFLQTLTDPKDFYGYKCSKDTDIPKYPTFCSEKMVSRGLKSCSGDYTHKTGCTATRLGNGCFQRVPVPGDSCIDARSTGPKSLKEHKGNDARCFEASAGHALCLQFRIDGDVVMVILGKTEVPCSPKESRAVKYGMFVDAKGGKEMVTFACPDVPVFIEAAQRTSCPDMCNYNGTCSSGKCVCFEGFDAADNCAKAKETLDANNPFGESVQ